MCVCRCGYNVELNLLIYRNGSAELLLEDLEVRAEFCKVIPKARNELLRVEESTTPLAKLKCLQNCMDILSGRRSCGNELDFTVTSEDLLPALIYVLAKTSLPNWYIQLHYIRDLQLAAAYRR